MSQVDLNQYYDHRAFQWLDRFQKYISFTIGYTFPIVHTLYIVNDPRKAMHL